jgi:hypothetical protein
MGAAPWSHQGFLWTTASLALSCLPLANSGHEGALLLGL